MFEYIQDSHNFDKHIISLGYIILKIDSDINLQLIIEAEEY